MSRRSTRLYVDDDMEKDTSEYQSRMTKHEEAASLEVVSRKNSTCSSTSQSIQSSRQTSLERTSTKASEPEYSFISADDVEASSCASVFAKGSPRISNGSSADSSSISLDELLPETGRPANFGIVIPGVYRSSFPQTPDHDFIETLGLKTMVTLVQKDFPDGYGAFISKNAIKHHVFDMRGTKKEDIPVSTMNAILNLVMDEQNHPVLIHCNHGKHRTGCVVGIIRKVHGWDLGNIITEYKSYAEPKVRECDVKYISNYRVADLPSPAPTPAPVIRETRWMRAGRFFRMAAVALVVTVIWMVSGARLESSAPRSTERSDS